MSGVSGSKSNPKQIELKSEYADIMELCLYNAVLTGMSLDGKAFTYVNQLASSDEDLSQRHEWFECACCPPNVTRTLGFLGGYVWSQRIEESEKAASAIVNVHLYTSAILRLETKGSNSGRIQIIQKTEWPWSGDVDFDISAEESGDVELELELRLRIPGWASESWEVSSMALFRKNYTMQLNL